MDCLKEAETLIPSDKYSITPVYLGATAGMRLIQYGPNFLVFFCKICIICDYKDNESQ